MSHFQVYKCNVSNVDFVKKSLAELGLGYKENVVMTDYYSGNRNAELVLMKGNKQLPIGWVRNTESGALELQADWFMTGLREKEFTQSIGQLHSKYQVLETCEQNGWSIDPSEITLGENGSIEILATQYS